MTSRARVSPGEGKEEVTLSDFCFRMVTPEALGKIDGQ